MITSPFRGFDSSNMSKILYIFLALVGFLMIGGFLAGQQTDAQKAAFILSGALTIGYVFILNGEIFIRDSVSYRDIDARSAHTGFNPIINIALAVGLAITVFVYTIQTTAPLNAAIAYGGLFLGLCIWSFGQSIRSSNPEGLVLYPTISNFICTVSWGFMGFLLFICTINSATLKDVGLSPLLSQTNVLIASIIYIFYNVLVALISNRHA